jgi:hypothetical protein
VIVKAVVVLDPTASKLPVIAPVELFKDTLPGKAPLVTAYVNEPDVTVAVTADRE